MFVAPRYATDKWSCLNFKLRDEKCRQNVNVHYADDYEAQKVLEEIKNQKC